MTPANAAAPGGRRAAPRSPSPLGGGEQRELRGGPITVLVGALGGQGGGVLAEWLVAAASRAGYPVQSTSIPGVAQRTGATTYYIEIFPVPVSELGGREPVLSLLPTPGCIDLLVASELLEAGRMIQAGFADALRTLVVTSTSRTLTTIEKLAMGDGRYASDRLLAVAAANSRGLAAFDMDDAARDAGTIVSAVMLGAIAGSGVLPFDRSACEAAIGTGGASAGASLRGFTRGFDQTVAALGSQRAPAPTATTAGAGRHGGVWADAIAAFPPSCRDIVAAGIERVAGFQDDRYAKLYLDRLATVRAAEEAADPRGGHGAAATREAARFLALWMAFDDIVRVADFKSRSSRYERVRREAGAGERDIVHVADYFKPGIPEIAGLMPRALAERLLAWDRRRVSGGRRPFAVPLAVRTDAVTGMLALRVLAGLRWLRPKGLRYAEEQAAIGRWLAAVVAALRTDWACGYELALAGRIVKGYGDTNVRGKRNLAHIVEHLAAGAGFETAAARAQAIREAREAALADEGGQRLDAALVRHGAPPRPVAARPVVWMKKPAPPPARGQA